MSASRVFSGAFVFSFAWIVLSIPVGADAEVGEFKVLEEKTEDGITERRFDIVVNGETVPGCVWTPEGAEGTRPLVAFGHGGSQDKRAANIMRMVRDYVTSCNYACVAIDGPAHGERVTPEEAARLRSDSTARRAAVRKIDTTAEWMAVIDNVQAIDNVGEGPVAYWGLSMGTRNGVPFVAADDRIKVAILGLFGLFPEGTIVKEGFADAARSIEIPLMFVFQWDDTLMTREHGIDLFDAFGSTDKVMHINPGGHIDVPEPERDSWKPFFVRYLGEAEH